MNRIAKRTVPILLMLCLMFSLVAVPAHAEETTGTSADTVVTYTVTSVADYVVVIPSSLEIPSGEDSAALRVECTQNNLIFGDYLIVSVDVSKTFTIDGNFYLTNTENDDRLLCTLSNYSGTVSSSVKEVARFSGGTTTPSFSDTLTLQVMGNAASAGTYTGHIFFTISTKNQA